MLGEHFTDLFANGMHGIQGRHRFLKNHADTIPANGPHVIARQRREVHPVKLHVTLKNLPHRLRQQPHDAHGSDALAATAFSYNPQGATASNIKAHAIHRGQLTGIGVERRDEVVYLKHVI